MSVQGKPDDDEGRENSYTCDSSLTSIGLHELVLPALDFLPCFDMLRRMLLMFEIVFSHIESLHKRLCRTASRLVHLLSRYAPLLRPSTGLVSFSLLRRYAMDPRRIVTSSTAETMNLTFEIESGSRAPRLLYYTPSLGSTGVPVEAAITKNQVRCFDRPADIRMALAAPVPREKHVRTAEARRLSTESPRALTWWCISRWGCSISICMHSMTITR